MPISVTLLEMLLKSVTEKSVTVYPLIFNQLSFKKWLGYTVTLFFHFLVYPFFDLWGLKNRPHGVALKV